MVIAALLFADFTNAQTKDSAYYANLRAYKKTNHQVAFGWISTGNQGLPWGYDSAGRAIINQIPDSMDIVDCWYNPPVSGSPAIDLIRQIKNLKGIRFLLKSSAEVYQFVEFGGSDFVDKYINKGDSLLRVGFDLVAKNMSDSITALGLDGVDFDHEPHYCGCDWGPASSPKVFSMFIESVSKYFGPLSGTGRLLTVNGEPDQLITDKARAAIDYAIQQAYDQTSYRNLQSDYDLISDWLPANKFIVTTNFEGGNRAAQGGGPFTGVDGVTVPALLGYAAWNPTQGNKGGAGAYHPEYDPGFNYMYQAIQIMNPAGGVHAGFSSNTTTIFPGDTVQFTNGSSAAATKFAWSFPGGTPDTSNDVNPVVVYKMPGKYTVSLTASNDSGSTDTNTSTNYITVANPVKAGFLADTMLIAQGGTVHFINSSTGATSYAWSFPGGTPSTDTAANPAVVYNTPGVYSVTLKAVNDSSTFADSLTQTNYIRVVSPSRPPGKYSLQFNVAASQYVGLGNININSNALTAAAWVNIPSGGGGAILGASDYSFMLGAIDFGSGSQVIIYLNTSGGFQYFMPNTVLDADKWYHLATVYDGDSLKLYINGVLDTAIAAAGSVAINAYFQIGLGGYTGYIDEVKLSSAALSADQIQSSMCATSPTEAGLIGYWPLNDGGYTVADSSGNGHNGTLVNMDASDWSTNIPEACAIGTPVTGMHLQAGNNAAGTVQLSWNTTTEINSKGFDVQRSADQAHWQSLHFETSKASGGNSTQPLSYKYTDAHPAQGLNYYRLQQTDLDGKPQWSNIVPIEVNSGGNITVYPNPTDGKVTVIGTANGDILKVYNSIGAEVLKQTSSGANTQLDLSNKIAGLYFILVLRNNIIIQRKKVVKK